MSANCWCTEDEPICIYMYYQGETTVVIIQLIIHWLYWSV